MNLDDPAVIEELDSERMLDRISALPRQCVSAWDQAQSLSLPIHREQVRHVVVVGMGGSAIGGALLQGLVADQCDVPVSVVRGYTLPAFVSGPSHLVVASSYSGSTEETLSCFEAAVSRRAQTLAITTGGKLAAMAEEVHAPVVRFNYDAQPRAALGFSLVLLLGVFRQLGLIPDHSGQLAEAVAAMEAQRQRIEVHATESQNPAKQVARQLNGTLPVVYGAGFLAAVANRWKTQLNENAKSWAFFEVLPELNHNAVVGLDLPDALSGQTTVVMLRSTHDAARVSARWDVTAELLARSGVTTREIWAEGKSKLAHMLTLIHFGDYVSFYLAMLNQIDPTPVENIAFLKRRLAELDTDDE